MPPAAADPPPKDGLGAGYPTVCFTASADHLSARASGRRLGSDSDDLTSPAGNGAACLLCSAVGRDRQGYRRRHGCGPSAPLTKSCRSRQLASRGGSSRRHTHTLNLRSTSSDRCRFTMRRGIGAVSEAVPSSSVYLRGCGARLARVPSTWSRVIKDGSFQAMPRRLAGPIRRALLTGAGPDHLLARAVASERRYERGAARRSGACPHRHRPPRVLGGLPRP